MELIKNKARSNKRAREIPGYLDTLDGFRAAATLMVMLFHYWQQSWVGYTWNIYIGTYRWRLSLEPWIVTGGLGVEVLFLLSGFCLFYPYALNPERELNAREYAWKRFVRIMPSYYLCFLTGAILYMNIMPWASENGYQMSTNEWWYHFVGGIFMGETATTRMFTNPFNGALWSLPIEVEFYILFPLILRFFRKRPTLVMVITFAFSESWRFYLRSVDSRNITFLMNQLPGMLDVFVGGMYAAYLTGIIRRARQSQDLTDQNRLAMRKVFTALTLGFLLFFSLNQMIVYQARYSDAANAMSVAQTNMRKFDTVAIGLALCCSGFSHNWLRRTLGNPFSRYMATISYQFYMWHMLIALKLKTWHIPPYTIPEDGKYPMHDDNWRMPYFLLCIALSFIAATLLTYCFERPVTRALNRHKPRWTERGGSKLQYEFAAVALAFGLWWGLREVLARIIP